MIKSMTAFANSEESFDEILLSWEIRSVNHRYLDASVYLPEGFANQEASLKELIRKKIGRGKVDARLVCNSVEEVQQGKLSINETLVKRLLDAQNLLEVVAKQTSSEQLTSLSTMEVLNFPGVLGNSKVDYSQYNKAVVVSFKIALNNLIASREGEGSRLKEMLLSRAISVKEIVAEVRVKRPAVVAALREKVIKKLSDLDIETDNNRLEQELVIQAQRLDVDEELDRLDSHVEELLAVLERNEPIGRRLDFLMQELNREANTLGSKANDAATTKASVELKVLIEQMREQVMNIE
ncbi:MAG: YicC/YloC family endoribonuclease [Cocleimonas sp.]